MWAEVIAGRRLSGWLHCWGEHGHGPVLRTEEEPGQKPASSQGRSCARSSHAKRSDHLFFSWEMLAFASEGPGRCPWCLSTSGPQVVFSKLSTWYITSVMSVQSCMAKFFRYIYLADGNSTWPHKESMGLSARLYPVPGPSSSGDLKCPRAFSWALLCSEQGSNIPGAL